MRTNHPYFLLPFGLAVAIIALLSLQGSFSPTVLAQSEHVVGNTEPSSRTPTINDTALVDPIPGGCPGNLPGDTPAVCCISGFVYLDGEPVAGAEVEIVNEWGDRVRYITHKQLGKESRAHYRVPSLSNLPLTVTPGQFITITARYSGHEHTIANYRVESGGQQVDLVLGRRQTGDAKFEQYLWDQAESLKFNRPLDVAIDSAGNLYVVDSANARVQVLDRDGKPLREWGEVGDQPGQLRVPTGITLDHNNNVYVADMGNHRIHKFSSDGEWLTSWGGWGRQLGEFDEPYDVAVDKEGNLYVSDSRNHRIQKLDQYGKPLIAWGKSGNGNEEFRYPRGIAIDSKNRILIADSDNARIQVTDSNGVFTTTIKGVGELTFNCPYNVAIGANDTILIADRLNDRIQLYGSGGNPIDTWGGRSDNAVQFSNPHGVIFDKEGNFYVVDTFNNRIQKYNLASDSFTVWGSRGEQVGQFNQPRGIHVNKEGTLFVADTFNDRIQWFNATKTTGDTWGTTGKGDSQFNNPYDITIDSTGARYVTDRLNHRVQVFNTSNIFTDTWGSFGTQNNQFAYPWGIAVDASDNIYVVDSGNNRIQKFNRKKELLATFGLPTIVLNEPRGIAVDNANNIYVADRNNHRIVIIDVTNNVTRTIGKSGSNPGEFRFPSDVAVDQTGNIYVADTENHRIQKLNAAGIPIAIWGERGSPFGTFVYPVALAVAPDGTLYVADSESSRVLRSLPMAYTRSVATIVHLSENATSLPANATLVVKGRGRDSDETDEIQAYRWTSDKDNVLGTAPTLQYAANDLAQGSHRLTLEVQDNEGEWSEPVSTYIYVAKPAQTSWTLLLYLVGDYDDNGQLMARFSSLLQTLRTSFNNPNVRIAVQVDGKANNDTRRLLFTPGLPPQVQEVNLGELAMDKPETLTDFVREGQEAFPADHYYLAIADHGQAIQGIGWDVSSPGPENYLTSREIAQALSHPEVAPIHVLHLDGCSMNLIDVAYELRKNTQYLIASQYLAWSYFAYDSYQAGITAATIPEEFTKIVVNGYAQLASRDRVPFTLSALNLARAEAVMNGVDQLSVLLKAWIAIDPNDMVRRKSLLNAIRSRSQIFNSNQDFLNNEVDAYVDLLDWVTNLNNETNEPFTSAIRAATTTLLNELKGPANISPFILANQATTNIMPVDKLPISIRPQFPNGAPIDLSRAGGVSLYYPLGAASPPTAEMAVADKREPTFDTIYAEYLNEQLFEFTLVSRWNEFLAVSVGAPIPNQPPDPPPGPLAPLDPSSRQIFLPLVLR